MENKDSVPEVETEAYGVYQKPEENFIVFWKQLTLEQRDQYIVMTVDMLLADPGYKPQPPELVLSRDEWITRLKESSKMMLKIKT